MASRGIAKPKHLVLYEDLGRAIQAGSFAPGQKLPTETQLMHQYGVSRTTVTRTLRDLEHRGIIWRRQGSGTFVKEVVKQLKVDQFGMMVHGVEPGSIFLEIYEVLARATNHAGAHLQLTHLCAGENRAKEAADSAQRMINAGVRGVFYLPHSISPDGDLINSRVVDLFTQAGVAVVLLDRDIYQYPRRSDFDLVSVDNTQGGHLLGQHLIDVGCKRTMFFTDGGTFSSSQARWVGYRMAMEANGLEPRTFGCNPGSAEEVMRGVRKHRADGIVCENDRYAAIVMRHLLNAKVAVPDEIRIAGFDNTPTASLLAVPLTTVKQPAGAIAQRAVSLMNDRLKHPNLPPAHMAVHCELIVRESTALRTEQHTSGARLAVSRLDLSDGV
ncbi:MAG TPA: GntR family transcriptional regulator [Tepidisphaeraceae bacterium]|nr:GntR family transcriptional regulator [Tepidisphaeraceae bacterium]